MIKKKYLNVLGVAGLTLSFIYFVAWTPGVRVHCNNKARDVARNIPHVTKQIDDIQNVGLAYSAQYMICTNKYGVAE